MASVDARHTITMYSDYVCPFCYLGRASLSTYLKESDNPPTVDWHPFDLRARKRNEDGTIDHDVDDGKDDTYYTQARENVRRLQDQYDVEMTQELATDVDSFPAQVAAYFIQENRPDQWADFDDAVFEALWVDGRDIGEVEVLAELAEGCGLDPSVIRDVIEDPRNRGAVRERFRAAREAGVTGVPTFAYDGHAARGAVPPAQLARLVDG